MRTRERTALYRFWDRGGALLYVGITNNVQRRWEQHAADKDWWPHVAHRTVEWYPSRRAALRAEYRAIRSERPIHNQQHNYDNPHRIPAHSLSPTRRAVTDAQWSAQRKVYPVGRYQPFIPLAPLAVLLLIMLRVTPEVRIFIGVGVGYTLGFLACVAWCWRPMWKNVRELWR